VHLAGFVTIKSGTFIGIGACSVPGVTIGVNCTIGAGAVIIGDIPDNVVAAGVPAKVIRSQS
jgi:acetyltransferase-like isoleucine patch superfamily enzyme